MFLVLKKLLKMYFLLSIAGFLPVSRRRSMLWELLLFPSLKDPFSPKGYVSFSTLRKHSSRFTVKGFGVVVFILK